MNRSYFASASCLALMLGTAAAALPVGGNVAAGSATIAGSPTALTINQASQNAIINWQGFSIGRGEAVTFVQPNARAVALNRVVGSDPSTILGSLSANGQVFLVNPNGVMFGTGSQVNVGGLVASTRAIADADFMAGRYSFNGSGGGAVRNRGTITADGGFVALLGATVSNEGLISARLGTVALAAGEAMTLDLVGNGLLNVTVDRGAVDALVENGGMIRAAGGQVVMSARAAGSLVRTVVNNSGIVEAQSIDSRGGVIRLVGDGGVTVGGRLAASEVTVTGRDIALTGAIDASGANGGGTVLIGGGSQGKGALVHAASVTMAPGATITADATASGSGGTVVLWSDGFTRAAGSISARSAGGNGGFVETSGKTVSVGDLSVDTRSPGGKTGLWLLDPVDYRIAIAGSDETPSQVTLSLANSDRTILADNNITVDDAITWTTPQALELRAGNNVLVNAAITGSTAGSTLRIIAGNQAIIAGALTASAQGSLIQIDAGQNIIQNQAITASGGGAILLRADIDGTGGPGGGTVVLNPLFAVTSTSKTIFYSPENGYAAPNDYTGFTAYMWTFVAALDKVYDATTPAVLGFRGDPTVGGTVDVQLTGATGNFVDPNVGALKIVNYNGAAMTGGDAPRYALFAAAGQTRASITPAALTVTANNATKAYGDAIVLPGTAFTSAGLVAGETIGSVTEVSAGTVAGAGVAGSPYAITPSDATGGSFAATNYTITYVNGTLLVTPAALVVTANSSTKTYGQSLSFTGSEFTTTGLKNGESIGSIVASSVGAGATAGVAAGPYAISASGASGGTYTPANYSTTYVDGALTVTPAALTIRPDDASKVAGTELAFASTAFTTTGLQNGESIGGITQTSDGAPATASTGGSPYAIVASNPTGGTYTPSNYATTYTAGRLTVTPAPTSPTPTSPGPTSPGSTSPTPTSPTPTPDSPPASVGGQGFGFTGGGGGAEGNGGGGNGGGSDAGGGGGGQLVETPPDGGTGTGIPGVLIPGVVLTVFGGGVKMPEPVLPVAVPDAPAPQFAPPQAPAYAPLPAPTGTAVPTRRRKNDRN